VSMGAATGWLGGSEGEWLALYRAADVALYEAKAAGRDRLVVAPLYGDSAAAQAA
jgi:PleD family two-component response regulator